jgi:hypothetical protein
MTSIVYRIDRRTYGCRLPSFVLSKKYLVKSFVQQLHVAS